MKTISTCALILLCCFSASAAEWLTNGGDPQRTNWQRDEHLLDVNSVKNLKLLWKVKLDSEPREMHSLFPPLIATDVKTAGGTREVAYVAGISDNIFAIDVKTHELIWKRHFTYPTPHEGTGWAVGDPLCPGGQTASPVIGPPDAQGRRILYALAGNGDLHFLNIADGEEVRTPVKFSWANGKAYALNLSKGIIYTTTSQSCNGNPNQMWAMDVNDANPKLMTFNPRSGGLWGREGAAIDFSDVVWAPTGDGTYDPENFVFGNGLVGAKVIDGKLLLEDWFEPVNWAWLQKRDLDMQVTPAIFKWNNQELLATASKACRVYLLDTKAAGGEDHQTPLAETPLVCNKEVNFASTGMWGSLATWQNPQAERWIFAQFWGPVRDDLKVPLSYGPVQNGAILGFKMAMVNGAPQMTPMWLSRDMNRAEPPLVSNGVVFAYGSGENTAQAYRERGLYDYSPERIRNSTHAVLYALDAETGKELYSSGDQITSFLHMGGLSLANGRVYIATYDSTVYCFGLDSK